jgi:hypothetical protein
MSEISAKKKRVAYKPSIQTEPDVMPTPVQSRYRPFGKYIINTHLFSKNIISIKYTKNAIAVPNLPKRVVSDELLSIIENLVDTGELQVNNFKQLSDEEYDFILKILMVSGLRRMIKTPLRTSQFSTKENEIEFWKQKFTVLQGQVGAGNDDNDKIYEELRTEVIPKLYSLGVIAEEKRAHMLEVIHKIETS